MVKIKKIGIITIIIAVAFVLITIALSFGFFNPLIKLDSKQVVSVGFAGVDNDEIFFAFSEKQSEEFIEMVKEAKLSGFPVKNFGEIKGGTPPFVTRIITNRQNFDISYLRSQSKTFLLINGIGYECDEPTVEKISEIIYQQQNIVCNPS